MTQTEAGGQSMRWPLNIWRQEVLESPVKTRGRSRLSRDPQEEDNLSAAPLPKAWPNKGLQSTPSSVRSCLAPPSGRG